MNLNVKNIISAALLSLIALYGITSSGNIIRLVETVHEGWVAWTLGCSLGFTLVVASFIAATARTKQLFNRAMLVAILSGLMSAVFQTYIYLQDGADWYIAGLLGFGIPLVGEVGVALLDAAYTEEHQAILDKTQSDILGRKLEAAEMELTKMGEALTAAKAEMERMAAEHNQRMTEFQNQQSEKMAEMTVILESTREENRELEQELAVVEAQLSTFQSVENGNHSRNEAVQDGKGEDEENEKSTAQHRKPKRSAKALAKLKEVVEVVGNRKITDYKDLAAATTWPPSTAHRYFNMATEDELICLNGDGCYHVA